MTETTFHQQSGHVVFPRPCTLEEVEGVFPYIVSEVKNCISAQYDIHTKAEWNPGVIKTRPGAIAFLTATSIEGIIETTDGTILLRSTRAESRQFEHVSLAVRPTINTTIEKRQQAYENVGITAFEYFKQYETVGARTRVTFQS